MGDVKKSGTNAEATMSIGALSRATDIPVNTIRTWERRYGYPEAHRTESGHRLYRPDLVSDLRLVARALSSGFRPRQVLGRSVDDLRSMVGQSIRKTATSSTDGVDTQAWMDAVSSFDAQALTTGFRSVVAQHGLMSFCSEYAPTFLTKVGLAWQEGQIEIHHEHFGSEVLRDFLVSQWRPLSLQSDGPVIVCGTLPAERHQMGLHLAACVFAALGNKVIFLGADTPLESLTATVVDSDASILVISSSVFAPPEETLKRLKSLRLAISSTVEIWVGGGGASSTINGVTFIDTIRDLAALVANRS